MAPYSLLHLIKDMETTDEEVSNAWACQNKTRCPFNYLLKLMCVEFRVLCFLYLQAPYTFEWTLDRVYLPSHWVLSKTCFRMSLCPKLELSLAHRPPPTVAILCRNFLNWHQLVHFHRNAHIWCNSSSCKIMTMCTKQNECVYLLMFPVVVFLSLLLRESKEENLILFLSVRMMLMSPKRGTYHSRGDQQWRPNKRIMTIMSLRSKFWSVEGFRDSSEYFRQ